jgi:hypothetical protein
VVATFVVIYLILTGSLFNPNPSPPVPPHTGPTGGPFVPCAQPYQTDDFNCGSTGVQCDTPNLLFCTNCTCQCVTGSTLCPSGGFGGVTGCVFTYNDINNCGSCGRVCALNEVCCSGTCVNTLSSITSCGGCNGLPCTGTTPIR